MTKKWLSLSDWMRLFAKYVMIMITHKQVTEKELRVVSFPHFIYRLVFKYMLCNSICYKYEFIWGLFFSDCSLILFITKTTSYKVHFSLSILGVQWCYILQIWPTSYISDASSNIIGYYVWFFYFVFFCIKADWWDWYGFFCKKKSTIQKHIWNMYILVWYRFSSSAQFLYCSKGSLMSV